MESIADDTYDANELYKYVTESNKEANKFNTHSKKGKEKNKDVFSITQCPSPIESLELIDLKFKGYGVEDELYLVDDKAFAMLRRGSSLIYHKETKEYHIARAGLVKFFDYKKNYDSKEKSMKRRVTLPMVESKKKQSVYLTEKANGENFQVSYNKKYSCFIVGSKNVTIAIRNEDDIKWYETYDGVFPIMSGLKNLQENQYSYRYMRIGEDYGDVDEYFFDGKNDENIDLEYPSMIRRFDDKYVFRCMNRSKEQ